MTCCSCSFVSGTCELPYCLILFSYDDNLSHASSRPSSICLASLNIGLMISLMYGGITHHYMAPTLNYCKTINNVGTIHNEYVIAMAGSANAKIGILKGKDSAIGYKRRR